VSPLHVFPENGLNGSLHAPVLVGLFVLTFFSERLGWTYAGLVVPGYLATVFVQAPYTGALILFEALATYGLTVLVGTFIPRLGAWSSTFGRERFFLFIVLAVLVRLVVEGNILPWLSERVEIAHARELYSIGLALVPLLANAFWNGGLGTAAPRLALVTGITFACIKYVLLPYTNFTVSHFAMANEAVSLMFLESPHAHIILVVGALLGARNNVRYGWDYNGILVPALLAVAWYQPLKLLTTVIEAILVYQLARFLSERGPLQRFLIVGSRRMLVVFVTGFALKMLLGFFALRFAPAIQVVDYYGFGYLLPSLLAVKIWNRQKIGTVIMPTLHVSLLGFVLGNALGFGLTALDERWSHARTLVAEPSNASRSVPMELVFGDSAPAPSSASVVGLPDPHELGLRIARDLARGETRSAALEAAARARLSVRRAPGASGWYTIVPRAEDPEDDRGVPRLALSTREDRQAWLVIADAERRGSEAPAIAYAVAETLRAKLVLVKSRIPELGKLDLALAARLAAEFDVEHLLWVSTHAERARLAVVGAIPPGLDVTALGRALDRALPIEFVAPAPDLPAPLARALRLELPSDVARASAARTLPAPEPTTWASRPLRELRDRIGELTLAPAGYQAPSIEELRAFSGGVWPAVLEILRGGAPDPWQRALAHELGYAFVQSEGAWLLLEPPGPKRRGNATFVITPRVPNPERPARGALAIEVPAPRWEHGVFAAGLGIHAGLRAELLILPGVLPNASSGTESDVRRPSGRRSFYHRAHEEWLASGGNAVAVSGIAAERAIAHDAVLSFGAEIDDPRSGPSWALPLVDGLSAAGLSVGVFDGSLAHASFEGSTDPAFDYARHFARGQMLVLWLAPGVRDRWSRLQSDQRTDARLARLGVAVREAAPAERAAHLLQCARDPQLQTPDCAAMRRIPNCDPTARVRGFLDYAESGNPFELEQALALHDGCHFEVLRDPETGYAWALIVGSREADLLLLRAGATQASQALRTPAELSRAVALGLGGVHFVVP
jgi:gamma-polyglutamate biosynthesis protein CapC